MKLKILEHTQLSSTINHYFEKLPNFLNGLCSRIVDHRNRQIDYLFTRILNLFLKLFKCKNKSECKSFFFFVSFYSKIFWVKSNIISIVDKIQRASACEKKFFCYVRMCVLAQRSTITALRLRLKNILQNWRAARFFGWLPLFQGFSQI